jgi:hypothetical protein
MLDSSTRATGRAAIPDLLAGIERLLMIGPQI